MKQNNANTADLPRRRKKTPWTMIVCLILLAVMILDSLPGGEGGSALQVEQQVLSGKPEAATLSAVLSGAGTIFAEDTREITIPSQVEVLSYHVRNGDLVNPGDVLATVDKVTAAGALETLSQALKALDADLEAARQETADTRITASAAGRVKKIFAREGESVADTVAREGALMLLSLDGRMAVTFSMEAPPPAGEGVSVILSDGTVEEGKIASVRETKVTVTLSDETAPYGDTVTVTDVSGSPLGTGTLEIHSQLKVTGYYGTVSSVSVKENSRVSAGTTLLTLKDTGHTADYRLLLARRGELEGEMARLSRLAVLGQVLAEGEGIVTGVPETATIEPLSSTGGYRAVLLSEIPPEEPPREEPPGEEPEAPSVGNGTYAAKLVSASEETLYLWVCPEEAALDADLSALEKKMTCFGAFPHSGISEIPLLSGMEMNTVELFELRTDDLLLVTILDGTVAAVHLAQRISAPSAGGDLGALGGLAGMFGTFGGTAQETPPAYETYDAEGKTLLSLSDRETALVTIEIDELDILRLMPGMEAQVTLDAMKGTSFLGTIRSIATQGTSSGGNAKFSVTVALPRQGNMLEGMNASVVIVTGTSEAAVTVPAAALVEENGKTWVYTAYDEKKDALGGLVEVKTGLSDGNRVEILSGLTEADTFYYRYAERLTYEYASM